MVAAVKLFGRCNVPQPSFVEVALIGGFEISNQSLSGDDNLLILEQYLFVGDQVDTRSACMPTSFDNKVRVLYPTPAPTGLCGIGEALPSGSDTASRIALVQLIVYL